MCVTMMVFSVCVNECAPSLYYGSFPPSGTGQYSMVRYSSGPNTLIQLVFPLPTVPLLDRRGVCRKVAIDNNVRR